MPSYYCLKCDSELFANKWDTRGRSNAPRSCYVCRGRKIRTVAELDLDAIEKEFSIMPAITLDGVAKAVHARCQATVHALIAALREARANLADQDRILALEKAGERIRALKGAKA